MPFPMTHLIVAHKMAESYPNFAADPPRFFLGAIAPDAVHYRDGFTGDDKKRSHLTPGDEAWGLCTRNDEWAENALELLRQGENLGGWDFIRGYAVHILCDICNNIYVWTPFRLKHPGVLEREGRDNISHRESGLVDLRLSQIYAQKPEIWEALGKARAFDFEGLAGGFTGGLISGLISKEELEKIRRSLLCEQYNDLPETDTSGNVLHTCESQLEFVDRAVEFIAEMIYS